MASGDLGVWVTLHKAEDLNACDLNGFSDPYVKMKLFNGLISLRSVVSKTEYRTLNPEWEEKLYIGALHNEDKKHLGVSIESCNIRFQVWDKDRVTADDFIGQATLPMGKLNGLHSARFVLDLNDQDDKPQKGNKLHVTVELAPPPVRLSPGGAPTSVHHHVRARLR